MTPQVAVIFISKLAYIVYYRNCQIYQWPQGPQTFRRHDLNGVSIMPWQGCIDVVGPGKTTPCFLFKFQLLVVYIFLVIHNVIKNWRALRERIPPVTPSAPDPWTLVASTKNVADSNPDFRIDQDLDVHRIAPKMYWDLFSCRFQSFRRVVKSGRWLYEKC